MRHKDLKNSKKGVLLQTLMSILLLILISSIVIYSRWIIQTAMQRDVEERALTELGNLAEHETHHLEDLANSTYDSLDAFGDFLVLSYDMKQSIDTTYINSYLQSQNYQMLGISNLQGETYCYGFEEKVSLYDLFPNGDEILRDGKHICNLHALCDGVEMIAFAGPMYKEEEIVGAIYCGYPLSLLSTIFSYPDFRQKDTLYVTDTSGMILYASYQGELSYIAQSFQDLENITILTPGVTSDTVILEMQSGGTGTITVRNDITLELLYLVYMPVENTDYYMFTLTGLREAIENFSTERLIIQRGLRGILIVYSIVSSLLMLLIFYRGFLRYSRVSVIVQEQQKQIDSLETELSDARIRNSLSQLEPHFLYNALGSIRQIVLEDPNYAADLIYDFTIFLRSCVRSLSSEEMIPFTQELENIRAYCSIEKMRFGDRLNIEYETPVKDFSILPLTIQPLVENAIRHGICARRHSTGTVRVITSMEADSYVITVSDDGVGFDYDTYMQQMKSGERDSTGLMNLRFRLENIMKGEMRIESKEGEGTVVEIRIPVSQ